MHRRLDESSNETHHQSVQLQEHVKEQNHHDDGPRAVEVGNVDHAVEVHRDVVRSQFCQVVGPGGCKVGNFGSGGGFGVDRVDSVHF